jgi:DNA-binding GntR family transcriptional regulator
MTEAALQPIVMPRAPKYREVAFSAIKKAILTGQLEPNHPIFEEQLAAMFSISRTPVREALALLEHDGLITSALGSRGLFVRQLSQEEFIDIFSANEVIEPFLARRAANLANDVQIQAIETNVDLSQRYVDEGAIANFLEVGRDFHRLVGVAAGNLSLTETVIRNEERTDLYLMSRGRTVDFSSMQVSVNEHRAIMQAIKRHDPEAAARCIIAHAGSVRSRYLELITEPAR